MNRRKTGPWKPILLAFGATLLTITAFASAAAIGLSPADSIPPFESHPSAVVFNPTGAPTPKPAVEVVTPVATTRPAPIVTVIPTPVPTPLPTPEPTPVPPPPAPAAVDSPAPPPPPPPTAAPTPIPGEYRNDLADQVFALLNNERTKRGIAAVGHNTSLSASADYYARLIWLRNPYDLNHWLDGGPGDRAWGRGYCCGVGEVLVEAEGSAQTMVDLWMGSPPHHDVILDPQYVVLGVSCYDGAYVGEDGATHHPIVCAGDFGSG
jgi:uncharacterized protein YkwD